VRDVVRLAVERLDRLDAMLDLRAEALRLYGVPIALVEAQARLADGRLQIEPVADVLAGKAEAQLSLANGGEAPRFELTARFGGVETSELAAALGIDHEVFGELQGQLELTSAASQNILDGAEGSATVLMSGGQLSEALAELVDMDFAERIVSSFKNKTDEMTPIRCAIADFEGQRGIFESQALIVDTGEVKLVGAGTIDLAERRVDLVVRPYGKDFSLLSSDAPLRITGPLSNPDVAPEKGELAVSLLTPIEIGRAENADCEALVQWASEAMAASERRTAARRSRR
jgi:uncharacterized protein involved in outer membrane biogenesis